MQKSLAFLGGLLLLSVAALGQKITVDGIIKDENDQAMEMANLLVLDARDSSMVTYGFSDAEGAFRFKLKTGEDFILRVSYLGYQSKDLAFTTQGENQKLALQLMPDTETLQGVDVVEEMPIVISGDTISYKADAFTTGQERKLEDVLKRLPGVEVDDDGQVKVEGKVVEKVMVEGKDFFDGDSKVATKNIPADAVDKVQVVHNYEEISPLAGLSSEDRVALNIKLKEGKKNLWFGDVEAKGGDPNRYLAHGNAFYYTPKASFNLIGDINNIGKPAFTVSDYFRFSGGFRNLANRSGSNFNFAMDDIGIPLGQNNRAENMISRFGAANFNYSPSKPLTISGFVIANENVISSPYETQRSYIGLDSLNTTENLTTENFSHPITTLGKVSVLYKPKKELQVNYDLFAKISDQRESTNLFSDFGDFSNSINTHSAQKPYEIKQNLGYFMDAGKSVYTLEVQHLMKRQDPSLALQSSQRPFGLAFNFSDTNRFRLYQQKLIESQQLQANGRYYYVINKKNHIELSLGSNLNYQQFSSDIDEGERDDRNSFTDPRLENQAQFRLTDVFSGVHYKAKVGNFTFRPGFNYHYYQLNQQQENNQQNRQYWLFLPDALVKYEFGKSENITLRYSMQARFNDVNQIISGRLIQSYNSLFTGNTNLTNATFHNASLNYFNYDMFNFTTIYGGINYSRTLNGITNGVQYTGFERVFSPINAMGFNESLSGFGAWSRKFEWVKTDARVNYNYGNTNNQVNGRQNNNSSFNQTYNTEIGTNFEKWPNFEVGYSFTHNQYSGANTASVFTNHRPSVELTAVLFKDFVFRSEYSYNNYGNPGSNTRTSFDFWDASLEYQQKDSPWLYSLEILNILDTRFVREDGLNDNLITTTAYTVLPRYLLFGVRYDL